MSDTINQAHFRKKTVEGVLNSLAFSEKWALQKGLSLLDADGSIQAEEFVEALREAIQEEYAEWK